MIQRIQTVWWLLSGAVIGIFLFMPLFQLDKEDAFFDFTKPLVITGFLSIALSIAVIFFFKNRPLQIRIGYVIVLLQLLMCFLIGYYFYLDKGQQLSVLNALPLISLVLQVLAIRAVKKDEALIKSMDRLR